jgi:hypothetical protein
VISPVLASITMPFGAVVSAYVSCWFSGSVARIWY